ncbi:type I-E CRISPR-associated protein Cas5/CasD [Atlantibacter hermannii]|uniref:type I-E CRISPR-associated protein Cas5/CasD n=1 Tax=Atlantibacter hermannii TaxID=565 RepID=UPI0029101D88|nr:type I-E CRISPR-associated protein Cas5/CasD [Atlantibacter hermannii]MDU7390666.1 type I-E CRISPR-associated protein Cas5/CasD [Atlantibacter hermannii]
MNKRYLLLWLEGPLQSWGHDSRFGRRDTLPFPTMSGVCGILCAALGAGGEQCNLLTVLTAGHWHVRAFARAGERTISPPLRDFQMVGSGYDETDPWQLLLIPKTSEGKKAVGGGTKMTYRYYLQDCAFAVVIALDSELAHQLAEALAAPVWELSLGRKNCAPTEFICQGVYDSECHAWEHCAQLATEKKRVHRFDVVPGADAEKGEVMTLNDVPLQFGEDKRYRDRQVTLIPA